MRNFYKALFIVVGIALCNCISAQICLGDDTTICVGQSVNISVLCSGNSQVFVLDSMQQVSLTDDQYSGVVNIGFSFTYYGVVYSQLIIASNNYVTFDLTQANGYSPWSIGNPIPSPALPVNSIMGPYQDINPALGGTIEYGTIGVAPNRKFVVRYNQVPMFSCTNDIFCSSIVLYEGTNDVEVHIDNKPLCPTWNAGVAIEGIQDVSGTLAAVVTGRNFPTQWTATADAARMSPINPTSYNVSNITYVPSLLASGITWWDTWGNMLGTGLTINVTPTNDTTGYYVVYDQCYASSSGPQNTDTAWVYRSKPQISATSTGINCLDTAGTAIAIGSGIAPFTYQWNDPFNQTTDTATALPYGNYIVTITDSIGCTDTALVSIDSLLYNLNPGSITTLCNGDSSGSAFVNVTLFDTSITYLWDANAGFQTNDTASGLSAGSYSIVITDSIGCKDSTIITVNDAPAFIVQDSIINPSCVGNSNGSIFVNVSGGTPGYSYSWGNNQLTGLSAGTYSIIITDSNNCIYVDSFLLVDPLGMTISLDSFPASCGLSDGSIAAIVQGGTPGYSFNWIPGGFGTDTLYNAANGSYTVIVTDANGCTDTASTYVNQIKGYTGDFSLTPNQGPAPLSVFLTNNSVNCVTYFWDFGNGNTSNSSSPPPEIYQSDGTYTITLIACNAGGCCDTIVKTVIVESQSICNFGKVFSPNGDGFNDKFEIVCERISTFDIIIYNRWGNEMFISNNINISWDGTKGGNEAPEGTYYFIINAFGVDGQDWSRKGSLTLFR